MTLEPEPEWWGQVGVSEQQKGGLCAWTEEWGAVKKRPPSLSGGQSWKAACLADVGIRLEVSGRA